jgi:hypothetical protein
MGLLAQTIKDIHQTPDVLRDVSPDAAAAADAGVSLYVYFSLP